MKRGERGKGLTGCEVGDVHKDVEDTYYEEGSWSCSFEGFDWVLSYMLEREWASIVGHKP